MLFHPNQPYKDRLEWPYVYRDTDGKYRELPKTGLHPSKKAVMANDFIGDLWFRQGHDKQVAAYQGYQLDEETRRFVPVAELDRAGKMRGEDDMLLNTLVGAKKPIQIGVESRGPFRKIAMFEDRNAINRMRYDVLWSFEEAEERAFWGGNHPGLEFAPFLVQLSAYSDPTWRVGYHVRGHVPEPGFPAWQECPPGWFGGDRYMGPEPTTPAPSH